MLHINKITIKNFRPYYGVQIFNFGKEKGLSIVLGNNGTGKTSLIRAIKFVLYDELDSVGNFKIKNELNIIAWEQQDFHFFVALDFAYNEDEYILKRVKNIKAEIYGAPTSDVDFESTVTLIKNGEILSKSDTNKILKSIIPKEISEYILFEGETISKYKKLLDNNSNDEIYDSIRKILGIKILENSKNDLEKQLEKFDLQKTKKIKEQTKNLGLQKQLSKYQEELQQFEKYKSKTEQDFKKSCEEKEKYENILKDNGRIRKLIDKKYKLESHLNLIDHGIQTQKEKIKIYLKDYKIYCLNVINLHINNIPNKIEKIKKIYETNENIENEIKISTKILNDTECKYCGHKIEDESAKKIKERINFLSSQKNEILDFEIELLTDYNKKNETLKTLIQNIEEKDFENDIKNIEIDIQTKLIEKEKYKDDINEINHQIDDLGGINDIEETIKSYSISSKNVDIYQKSLNEYCEEVNRLKNKINILNEKNPVPIDLTELENKIKITNLLIKIFSRAIGEYSENMRKRVQEDATNMFKKISENKEYNRLEFDKYYGLKLFDINDRVVPNISTGFMTLITISLIYGLHHNSSLTGTIILDAPFSVLTDFHRNNIISTFQTLSPQVLLFVYEDQIDLNAIREIMEGKLINEYEIYQNKNEKDYSYKTNIKETK